MGQTVTSNCKCDGVPTFSSEVKVVDQLRFEEPAPGTSADVSSIVAVKELTPLEHSYWHQKDFDYEKSTELAYAKKHFAGKNKDIRPLLDYTYHMMYKEDRVQLQDHIIASFFSTARAQTMLLLPWVIFTAGAMGAGKGHVMKWLNSKGYLPLSEFVLVDPDAIRQELPEWAGYVERDPESAAKKTQKEAGHIAEILGYRALREQFNVIFDGSLRDSEWYKVYFAKLRHAFPGVRIMILHIVAERDEVLSRAESRGRETGRMVPRELLESSMDAVPKSVEILAPSADVSCRVLNSSGKDPVLEREPGALNPPPGVSVSFNYLAELWKPIDTDGDGQLSRAEVLAAIAHGKLTETVLDTVDVDKNGEIDKEEIRIARERCFASGTLRYMNPGRTMTHALDWEDQMIQQRSKRWG